MTTIRFSDVTKRFSENTVVDRLSLSVESGEFVVLLGPSGCGKTTTLRMLAGLEDATGGDIFICDQRVNDLPPQHRDVAMVFQNYALYPHMTVEENIAYPLRVRKIARDEIAQRVDHAAALLEIGSLLSRRPRELSGGERQRVALARAIIREPRAFLMDEPLSNLDAKLRIQMRGELKHLQNALRTTTVYVTHDQAEAMTLAHRIAVMRDGKLQQFDSPMTIYDRPANLFVAEFVGNPGMNFIEGRIDVGERRFVAAEISIRISDSDLDRLRNHDRITLGIRPEHVRVAPNGLGEGIRARVFVTECLGNETLVFLLVSGSKIVARVNGSAAFQDEVAVTLEFDAERMRFFDSTSGDNVRQTSVCR